jgi:hypothetical protein
MTRYQVDPARLDVLGARVRDVAQELWWTSEAARTRAWAVGPGRCQSLLGEVLGDFEHERLVLGRALEELGTDVRRAGALYAEVDAEAAASLGTW